MRWVRFDAGDGPRIGRLDGDVVRPVAADRIEDVIAGRGTEPDGSELPVAHVRLLAPVTPSKVLAVGQNYLDHIREQGVEPPGMPLLFAKFPTSVIGPGEAIRWTAGLTEQVDYEAELAVVIGRRAVRVGVEEAMEHVFGYTGANDVSARDLQFGDGQWTRGKGLDRFLPLGPVVVEAAEVPDPQDVAIRCRVNGKLVQDASTREMVFSVAEIIAFASEAITLEPGDVLLTGTPKGVGYFREPQLFLSPGDTVEVEIGDLGVLSNPVGEPYPRATTAAIPVPALHHVNLKTPRLQEMIDWYGLVVGMRPTYAFPGGAWLSNDAANHRLALLSTPLVRDDPDKLVHAGIHHTAFEYGTLDELLRTYLRLRDHCVLPHSVLDHGMTLSFYYPDPDGNSVELQADHFGDWARSTEFMHTERFAQDPIGTYVDPEQLVAAWRAGAVPDELHRRAYDGEFAPAEPQDLRVPFA